MFYYYSTCKWIRSSVTINRKDQKNSHFFLNFYECNISINDYVVFECLHLDSSAHLVWYFPWVEHETLSQKNVSFFTNALPNNCHNLILLFIWATRYTTDRVYCAWKCSPIDWRCCFTYKIIHFPFLFRHFSRWILVYDILNKSEQNRLSFLATNQKCNLCTSQFRFLKRTFIFFYLFSLNFICSFHVNSCTRNDFHFERSKNNNNTEFQFSMMNAHFVHSDVILTLKTFSRIMCANFINIIKEIVGRLVTSSNYTIVKIH